MHIYHGDESHSCLRLLAAVSPCGGLDPGLGPVVAQVPHACPSRSKQGRAQNTAPGLQQTSELSMPCWMRDGMELER